MNRQLMPQKRRRSREIALQLGYEMDVRERLSVEDVLAAFPLEEEDPEIRDYACALVCALDRHKEAIDDLLREQLVGWRPERMVAVDPGDGHLRGGGAGQDLRHGGLGALRERRSGAHRAFPGAQGGLGCPRRLPVFWMLTS